MQVSTRLDDITFPTFRAVMDALRHTSGRSKKKVSCDLVIQLLESTVFWKTGQASPEGIKDLVQKVLNVTCAYNPPLVESETTQGGLTIYGITHKASALIDTGTSWKSVMPMDKWLKRLRGMQDAEPGWDLPEELLVPGFIASIDLWTIARAFCWETTEEKDATEESFSQNENTTRAFLIEELQHLDGINLQRAAVIEKNLGEYVTELGDSALRLNVAGYKKAVFYRLTTGFLMWLRGQEEDEILKLSIRPSYDLNLAKSFQPKYRERASWVAVMCLRFFGEISGALLPKHMRELPRLSIRLRQGVSSMGIPFLNFGFPSAGLSRIEVQELVTVGALSGSALLKSAEPLDLIMNNHSLSIDIRKKEKASQIVDDVFHFFVDQTNELEAFMKKSQFDIKDPWADFGEILRKILAQKRLTGLDDLEPASKIMGFVHKILTVRKLPGCRIIPQTDEISIRIKAKDDLVFHLNDGNSPIPRNDYENRIVVRIPWLIDSSLDDRIETPEVTSYGGMVLATLIGKEYLNAGAVINWARATVPGIISIKDIIETFDQDMGTLQVDLREALLKFIEPGID